MKIKTKLTLGVGLLFILIILLSIVGVKNINELKNDTKNILVANYNSLEYGRNMLMALEENSQKAVQKFESNLRKQKKNLTELDEPEITSKISDNFHFLRSNSTNDSIRVVIRSNIYELMDMNMNAIQSKSEIAKITAENAVSWIVITGTLCFLIAFILLVNLPSNIANPIKELTESIKQIAAKNYSERVHFESHSEYGQLAKSFNIMAKKLEEYSSSNIAKLMVEKQRIETLINNMSEPLIGLDENQKILFMNDNALKISGLKKNNVIGQYIKEVSNYNDLIRSLISDIKLDNLNIEIAKSSPLKIYADNKESYFVKEIIPIKIYPTGELEEKNIGTVILLQNITPYKELDFAKTNFIATISHELKTPIASIKMSTQLLENSKIGILNEEQKHLINSIKGDSERLLNITGELLNMSQVESGTIQIKIEPFEAKDIVDFALLATSIITSQKSIRFDISYEDNLPKVLGDQDKTSWVLTNLFMNAIRHSHDNSIIKLNVNIKNNMVVFSVTDFGQGIAPDFIDKVFDRFYRVPGNRNEGSGLGLSISKEFIEAQGGSINVKSEFGVGSTFFFSLNQLK